MNVEQERLWSRIEAALDARRRVADDPELAADLARDPELEEAARRLEARLALLAQRAPGTSRPARRPPALRLGLAAAGLLALGLATRTLDRPAPSVVHEARVAIERTTPPQPRGDRRRLENKRVVTWTVDGRPAPTPGDRR